ncbi:MAG: aldehyde dehydrogenase family protein [Acidimicrobiia bacterium]
MTLVESKQAPEWIVETFVDGKFVAGDGEVVEVPNPATEEQLAQIASSSVAQVDEAIAAARRAFFEGPWPRMSGAERGRLLHAFADRIEAMHDELTAAMVTEVGSPLGLAETLQSALPVQVLRTYADLAAKDRTEDLGAVTQPIPSKSIVAYRPTGVVGIVTAYNYPLLLAVRTMGGALAAGCTTVVLPSLRTPLSTLLLARAAAEAGIPEGVLNVVVGGPDAGRRISTHPDVAKVAFTGSLEVGRLIMAQAAEGVKGITLELGGKSPTLVLPGYDTRPVVRELHARYLRNAGQGCAAATRILVPRDTYDDFCDQSRAAFEEIRTGDPWDRDTIVGPLIRPEQRAKVEGHVQQALDQGAEVVAGGGRPDGPGWFMNALLLGGIDNGWDIARTELFGPVGVVLPYDDVEHGIELANDSAFGLAANVFAPDVEDALAVSARLQAGSVYVNGGGGFRPDAPFGGFKASGIGREYGEWGIREFLEAQHIQWPL